MRPVGCRITWDVGAGYSLWVEGLRVREIAEKLGVSQQAVMGAAYRYEWPARTKPECEATPAAEVVRRCPECLAKYTESHVCVRRDMDRAVTIGWAA